MGSGGVISPSSSALARMPLGIPTELLPEDLLNIPPGYRDVYFTYVYEALFTAGGPQQFRADPLQMEYDADFICWAVAFGSSQMSFGAGTAGPDMTLRWTDAATRYMDNIEVRVQQLVGTMAAPAPQYPPTLYVRGATARFDTTNISTAPVFGMNQVIFIGVKRIKDPYAPSVPRKRSALDRNKEIVFNYVLQAGENRGDLYAAVDADADFALRGYKIDLMGAAPFVQPRYRFSDDTGYRLSNKRILLSGTNAQAAIQAQTPVVTVWPEVMIGRGGKINIELEDVIVAGGAGPVNPALVRITFIGEKRYGV